MDGSQAQQLRICPICGTVFTPCAHGNAIKRKVFCGPRCKRRHFDRKKRKGWKLKPLPVTAPKRKRRYERSVARIPHRSGFKQYRPDHEIALLREVGRACERALQRNYSSGRWMPDYNDYFISPWTRE